MIWWTFSRCGADRPTVACAPRARRRQGRDLAEGRGEVGAVGEPQEQRVLAGLTAEGGAVARGHRVGEAQTLVDGHRQRPCSAGTDHVHAHAVRQPLRGLCLAGHQDTGSEGGEHLVVAHHRACGLRDTYDLHVRHPRDGQRRAGKGGGTAAPAAGALVSATVPHGE